MRDHSPHQTDPLVVRLYLLRVGVIRLRRISSAQMDTIPRNPAGTGELQDYGQRFVHLEEGLVMEFQKVMEKLADIDTNLSGISTTILEALSTQDDFSRSIAHDRINGFGVG
jgi:hypothetical protein